MATRTFNGLEYTEIIGIFHAIGRAPHQSKSLFCHAVSDAHGCADGVIFNRCMPETEEEERKLRLHSSINTHYIFDDVNNVYHICRENSEETENMEDTDRSTAGLEIKRAKVYLSDDGMAYCAKCGTELICNETGDMPEYCPYCKNLLDYQIFNE